MRRLAAKSCLNQFISSPVSTIVVAIPLDGIRATDFANIEGDSLKAIGSVSEAKKRHTEPPEGWGFRRDLR
jgi:hypothetical protein